MGARLQEFAREGLLFELDRVGGLRVSGALSEDLRGRIRGAKPALVAELATDRYATADEIAELRQLLAAILADVPEQIAEALAIACADPDSALLSLRQLAAQGKRS